MPMTVDEYIAAKIPAHHLPVVARLREVMGECAPDAAEVVSYAMICWKSNRLFAYLMASGKEVTLGFVHGAQFDDPHGLLKGRGKSTRHVKVSDISAIPAAAICDYVAQELAFDAG